MFLEAQHANTCQSIPPTHLLCINWQSVPPRSGLSPQRPVAASSRRRRRVARIWSNRHPKLSLGWAGGEKMKARGTALGHLGPKQQCIPCPPCHPETLRHVTYTLRVLINMPTRVRASLPPTFYASIGNPFRLVAVCPHSALSLPELQASSSCRPDLV